MTRPAPPPSLLFASQLAALSLLALVLPMWLLAPLLLDQSIYSYVGQTILAGGAPYLDAWEHKGPLTHLFYAGGLWLKADGGVRLLDTAGALLSLGFLYRIASQQIAPLAGPIAVILALLYGGLAPSTMAQTDSLTAYLLILLLWVLLKPCTSTRLLMAGLIQGALLMLKPTTALFGLALLWRIRHEPRPWRSLAVIAAGCSVTPALCLIWLAQHGALDAFWQAYICFNLDAHEPESISWDKLLLLGSLKPPAIVGLSQSLFLPLAGFGWWQWRRTNRHAADTIASLVGAALLAYYIQGLYMNNHKLPIYLPASLLAAPLIVRWNWLFILFLPRLLFIIGGGSNYPLESWQYLCGQIDRPTYESHFAFAEFNLTQTRALAQQIDQLTPPNSKVYIFGFNPGAYQLAHRRAPTRYFFSYPLNRGPQIAATRAQLLADLQADPPALIALAKKDPIQLMPISSDKIFDDFTELKDFTQHNYHRAGEDEAWVIYVRNP